MRIHRLSSSDRYSDTRHPTPDTRRDTRRGLSLAEVLIALFVLAIGMMGILALFPLGAAQMQQAVKDERSAQLASIMEGMFHIYWRDACLKDGVLRTDQDFLTTSPELQALDDPNSSALQFQSSVLNLPILKSSEPSYPLYLDPIGFATQSGGVGAASSPPTGFKGGVAGLGTMVPRRSIHQIELEIKPPFPESVKTAARIRFCSLLDDISFNTQGLANPVNRAHGYNAAGILQRPPKNNVRHEANLKVVVYKGRPPADTASSETQLGTATVTPNSDVVSFTLLNQGIPPLRKGSWIMLTQATAGERYADFYRVVGFTQTAQTAVAITVSPPIRAHGTSITATYSANVIYLEDVVEVFDRGVMSPFKSPGQ